MFWFWKREQTIDLDLDHEEYFQQEEARRSEILNYWEGLREWFSQQGYTLYKLDLYDASPSLETDGKTSELPYAYFGGDSPHESWVPLRAKTTPKVCYAQDSQGRHVAIKRIGYLDHTEECRIIRWLYQHRDEAEKNHILPILEVLDRKDQSFVVMPRWGDGPCELFTIEQIMCYIRCLLKAINFLHSNSIVHRDIKEDNVLTNHFGVQGRWEVNWMRHQLQSAGKLTYALFDFDLSMMLSPGERRLPFWRSFEIITVDWPHDTYQGELDYDPFIFEMGCLGIVLCKYFQYCIPIVPLLAPFLDKLITDNLNERFTSSQALAFFEQTCKELTPTQLATQVTPRTYISDWKPEEYNRWHGLPNDFVNKWGSFRAPLPTMYTRILRRICRTSWGIRLVRYTRFVVRTLKARFEEISRQDCISINIRN